MSTETIVAAAKAEAEEHEREPSEEEAEREAEREREEEEEEAGAAEEEEAPEPATDMAHEERMRSLDSETKRHQSRIRTIMGEDFDGVEPCPMCISPGVVFPFNAEDGFDQERYALVMAYFNAGAPDYREAPDSVECPTCGGWGELKSHSRRNDQYLKTCETCGARGWILKAELQAREDAARSAAGTPEMWANPATAPPQEVALHIDPSHPNYNTIRALMGGGSVG